MVSRYRQILECRREWSTWSRIFVPNDLANQSESRLPRDDYMKLAAEPGLDGDNAYEVYRYVSFVGASECR